MSKHILITRSLKENSPFNALKSAGYKVTGRSLLSFEPINPSYVPITQWYYFYSQTGVTMAANQSIVSKAIIKASIGTFGPATAQYFEKTFGFPATIIGSGRLDEHVDVVSNIITESTFTFVQGTASRRSIQCVLSPELVYKELSIYTSTFQDIALTGAPDVIIFTSPMNADSYFNQLNTSSSQLILSIGKTTHDHLLKEYNITSHYPIKPTETALFDLLATLI